MPIETAIPIRAATTEEFHELHTSFMAHASQIHQDYGGLLGEAVYKTELARRCQASGIQVEREVLLRVAHETFFKDYRIDLLVERKYLAEVKSVSELTHAHHEETATYVTLAGLQHGSLINFRGPRLARHLISGHGTQARRRGFEVRTGEWSTDPLHAALQEVTLAFCGHVGLGLDAALYRAAIANLIGGPTSVIAEVPIVSEPDKEVIGGQPMHLLNEREGLAVTCQEDARHFGRHLHRLLLHTALDSIAWIHLQPGLIEFELISRATGIAASPARMRRSQQAVNA